MIKERTSSTAEKVVKQTWLEFVPFDAPVEKKFRELQTWDVFETCYGCPNNKGTWAFFKHRIVGNWNGGIDVETQAFNVKEGYNYLPVTAERSSLTDFLIRSDSNYIKKDTMFHFLYVYGDAGIDNAIDKDTYTVVGKLVKIKEEKDD